MICFLKIKKKLYFLSRRNPYHTLKIKKKHKRVSLTCYEASPVQCHRSRVANNIHFKNKDVPLKHLYMARNKILITVKTYSSISSKYEELVCTAGFDEDGNFIRIYPIPFRKLDYEKQYRKYWWVEMDLVKNTNDFRPDSSRPANIEAKDVVVVFNKLGTEYNWRARKEIAAEKVYTDISHLIDESKAESMRT